MRHIHSQHSFSREKTNKFLVSLNNATGFLFRVKYKHTERLTFLIHHNRESCVHEALLTKLDSCVVVGIPLLDF